LGQPEVLIVLGRLERALLETRFTAAEACIEDRKVLEESHAPVAVSNLLSLQNAIQNFLLFT
jgi:hypothetical protein